MMNFLIVLGILSVAITVVVLIMMVVNKEIKKQETQEYEDRKQIDRKNRELEEMRSGLALEEEMKKPKYYVAIKTVDGKTHKTISFHPIVKLGSDGYAKIISSEDNAMDFVKKTYNNIVKTNKGLLIQNDKIMYMRIKQENEPKKDTTSL